MWNWKCVFAFFFGGGGMSILVGLQLMTLPAVPTAGKPLCCCLAGNMMVMMMCLFLVRPQYTMDSTLGAGQAILYQSIKILFYVCSH